MAARRASRSTPAASVASVAMVLLLALGVWLLDGRGAGTDGDVGVGRSAGDPGTSATAPAGGARSTTAPGASATGPAVDPVSGLRFVEAADLPAQADDTLALIDDGGPFPHAQDGSTFGNYEGLLPDERRGYYAEYTVETPGSDDRGARRIVAGDGGELYWTADHYASFARIRR